MYITLISVALSAFSAMYAAKCLESQTRSPQLQLVGFVMASLSVTLALVGAVSLFA